MRSAARSPHRLALFRLLAAAVALGASPAAAAPGPLVRVLLHEGRGPFSVSGGSLGPRPQKVSGDGSQVRLGGRPVGAVFSFVAGPDPEGWVEVAGRRVRGRVEVRAGRHGLTLVNVLPLEAYVAGVVGGELPRGFADEALKAQAVAARTFALHRLGPTASDSRALLRSTTGDQVYGGFDAEAPRIREAVEATRGEFLSYRGHAILAAYHASSGGRTAAADEVWQRPLPYLVSLPVSGEDLAPDSYWRAVVSRTTLGRALSPLGVRVGALQSLRVDGRSPSGRAARVQVRGSRGELSIDADELRRALGEGRIRSTRFEIEPTETGFVFAGTGHGHGVGMSQWGAEAMARAGAQYREILAHFYPGTRIESGPPPARGGPP